ncbi:hypothetical protein Lal_00040765 [Lupinus albus]|nr:hypothetical protein Lal_00040765 [Lupinus albus]
MLRSLDGLNHSDLSCDSLAGYQSISQPHGDASSSGERLSPIIEISDRPDLQDPWEDNIFPGVSTNRVAHDPAEALFNSQRQ